MNFAKYSALPRPEDSVQLADRFVDGDHWGRFDKDAVREFAHEWEQRKDVREAVFQG